MCIGSDRTGKSKKQTRVCCKHGEPCEKGTNDLNKDKNRGTRELDIDKYKTDECPNMIVLPNLRLSLKNVAEFCSNEWLPNFIRSY